MSSDGRLEPLRAALDGEEDGFGRNSSLKELWTDFGWFFGGEQVMRNRADPMTGSRVQ